MANNGLSLIVETPAYMTKIDRLYQWLTENPEQYPEMEIWCWLYRDDVENFDEDYADYNQVLRDRNDEIQQLVEDGLAGEVCDDCHERARKVAHTSGFTNPQQRDTAAANIEKRCNWRHHPAGKVAEVLRPHLTHQA